MTIHYAHMTWTTGAFVAVDIIRFAAFIISRSDDAGATWQPIARITDINVHAFNDYEGRRNTTSLYRIQTERDDGALSIPSAADDATPTYTDCGYQFVTNEDPTLNQEYLDEPDRVFEFPDPVQEYELYGRNYSVIWRGTEDRGDVFTPNLWLYMNGACDPALVVTDETRGRVAFQPLVDLVHANLSYVCVHDQDGHRWFASLRMENSKATRREPGGKYTFPVRIRTVSTTPSTPDVIS